MKGKQLQHLGILICLILLFSSCVRLKDTVYLQGDIAKKLDEIKGQSRDEQVNYLVKVNDLLFIRVTSFDEKATAFLNYGSSSNVPNALAASLMGYRVGSDGCIDYPFIGKISVAGFTLSEIEQRIQLAVQTYVEENSATVKLLNDNITMLGEVKSPGRFLLNGEQISLMEAIATAGDLTDMANRKRVRLIRNDDGVTPQMLIIDVTDEKIMFSPYYYLKPGDIIYVEPKRLKQWSLSSTTISLVSSIVGIGLTIYTISLISAR